MRQRYLMVFLCFLLDSALNALFPAQIGTEHLYFVSCAGFCAVILNVRKMDLVDSLIMAAFAGMFYDFFYANTPFLYLVVFVLVTLLARLWIRVINQSTIENILLCIASILVREALVYAYMIFFKQASMAFSAWLSSRIFLTLTVNMGIVVLLLLFSYAMENRIRQKEVRIRKEEHLHWL